MLLETQQDHGGAVFSCTLSFASVTSQGRAQIPKGPRLGLLMPVLAVPHPLLWPSSGQASDSHSDWQWPAANRPGTALWNNNKEGQYQANRQRSLPEVWLVGASTSVTRRLIMMTTEHREVLSIASGAPRITSKPSTTPRARSVTHLCKEEKSETGWWAQGHPRPPRAEEVMRDSNPDWLNAKLFCL